MGSNQPDIVIDRDLCIGSGECVAAAPGAFALDDGDLVARVRSEAARTPGEALQLAIDRCPTGAISVRDAG